MFSSLQLSQAFCEKRIPHPHPGMALAHRMAAKNDECMMFKICSIILSLKLFTDKNATKNVVPIPGNKCPPETDGPGQVQKCIFHAG